MRRIRVLIEKGLPLVGMVVVFLGAVGITNLQVRLFVVVLGVLLIEAGVWKLATPFLPSERRYTDLRSEVDTFIAKVRRLNGAALRARSSDTDEDWAEVAAVRAQMLAAVDRMTELAGQEEGQAPLPLDRVRNAGKE